MLLFLPEDPPERVGRVGFLPPQMGSCQVLGLETLYKPSSFFRLCACVCSPGPPKAMPGPGRPRWPEHRLWTISTLRRSSVPQTCSGALHPPEAPATPLIYKHSQENSDQEQTAHDDQVVSSSNSYSLGNRSSFPAFNPSFESITQRTGETRTSLALKGGIKIQSSS